MAGELMHVWNADEQGGECRAHVAGLRVAGLTIGRRDGVPYHEFRVVMRLRFVAPRQTMTYELASASRVWYDVNGRTRRPAAGHP